MNGGRKKKHLAYAWVPLVLVVWSASLVLSGSLYGAERERVAVDVRNQMNGCAECHAGKIKTPDGKEKDVTLAAEVKEIPKHPKVDANITVKGCIACHKTDALKSRLVNRLHDVHLNSEIYTREFKQSCAGCHDMRRVKGM